MLMQLVPLSPGISAGPMTFLSVGDSHHQFYFICSHALDEVIEAQNISQAKEIIMSPTSWELCEQQRIRTRRLAGKSALKVGGRGGLQPFWRAAPGRGGGRCCKAASLNVQRAVAVGVG